MYEVNAVIGKLMVDKTPHDTLPENISKAPYWPIRLAYFEADKETPCV